MTENRYRNSGKSIEALNRPAVNFLKEFPMAARILRLYPGPVQESPVAGMYLAQKLHTLGSADAPFVYADFVSSLDGRIALEDPSTGESHLPAELRSASDFRLLLELEAQAECLITNSSYLRAIVAERLDDILEVGSRNDTADLAAWRRDNGLPPQPDVVIASASLDFRLPPSLSPSARRVIVATGETAPADKLDRLRARGYEVIIAGKDRWVEGTALIRALARFEYRSIFLLAGPRMLETMLRGGALSRLYLTMVHRLLGGQRMDTMIPGPELGAAGNLRLASIYYDAAAPYGLGQWFAQFETRTP
jgi:riboflavin biosynthesis pyrimidine reductase